MYPINSLGKLHETVLTKKLEDENSGNDSVNERQYGFVKRISTVIEVQKILSMTMETMQNML